MLEFFKGPFLVQHFSCYTLMTFLMVLSVMLLSMLMILRSKPESDLRGTVEWSRKWFDFNPGKTQLVSFDWPSNNGVTDVRMNGPVLEEQPFLKILGLTFSSKLYWDSNIIFIAKTAFKKIGALICSLKFLCPEVILYLYKSIIRPYMEYCCHL